MTDKKIITRFAPSPTGFMHVGGIRTALYAWLWARKNNGEFILRIEDTDKKREVVGSKEHIIESLKWLGLFWDKGPEVHDSNKYSYVQSERLDIYKKYAYELIKKGLAYPDPYSEEEINNFRKISEEKKIPFLYRDYRPHNLSTWDENQPLRFKITNPRAMKWDDAVFGELGAGVEALDDFILIKSDGYPTYNFAHIVDDIEMNITHVFRGQEFISSVPNYLALYEALETNPPIFVTTPPILGDSGQKKLSKRDGAKDILDYKKEGYLPEAMLNYLAFLGFNPGGEREIYSLEDLIAVFEINKIQRSGAKWNDDKLDWMNKEHIKLLPIETKINILKEKLPEEIKNNEKIIEKITPIIIERISKWSDLEEILTKGDLDCFFYEPVKIDIKKLVYKDADLEKTKENIREILKIIEEISEKDFILENIKNNIMSFVSKFEKRGEVLHPIRFALSGKDSSPDPFTIAYIIGKNETIKRLQKVI